MQLFSFMPQDAYIASGCLPQICSSPLINFPVKAIHCKCQTIQRLLLYRLSVSCLCKNVPLSQFFWHVNENITGLMCIFQRALGHILIFLSFSGITSTSWTRRRNRHINTFYSWVIFLKGCRRITAKYYRFKHWNYLIGGPYRDKKRCFDCM